MLSLTEKMLSWCVNRHDLLIMCSFYALFTMFTVNRCKLFRSLFKQKVNLTSYKQVLHALSLHAKTNCVWSVSATRTRSPLCRCWWGHWPPRRRPCMVVSSRVIWPTPRTSLLSRLTSVTGVTASVTLITTVTGVRSTSQYRRLIARCVNWIDTIPLSRL